MKAQKKIVITGANGYIGSVLKRMLPNCNLVCVDNSLYQNHDYYNAIVFNVHQLRLDLTKSKDMLQFFSFVEAFKPDTIINLAALVGAPICEKYPDYAWAINYDFVAQLVRFIKKTNDQTVLIYPNTNSGYGVGGESFCTEESPLNPISVYGKSKAAAETEVVKLANHYVFRLATVYGMSPRMREDLMVNNFTNKLSHNESLVIFEGNFRRNFVSIKSVAELFAHLAVSPSLPFGIYNLGTDYLNMTKLELARTIEKTINPYRPTTISEGDGQDPDKRDYIVSSRKLERLVITSGVSSRFMDSGDFHNEIVCMNKFFRNMYHEEIQKLNNLNPVFGVSSMT